MGTILQLVQDAGDDPAIGLGVRPSTLFPTDDDGDTSVRKMVRALTRTARDLAARYEWQALKQDFTFTSTAQEVQSLALPGDFLRIAQGTMWLSGLPAQGPVNDTDWAAMRAGRFPQVYPSFRIFGDAVHFWPVPGANLTVTYQYIRNLIGYAAGAVTFSGTTVVGSNTVAVGVTTGLSVGMVVNAQPFSANALITAVVPSTSVTLNATAKTAGTASFSARTPRTEFSADTDTTLWDDELMTLGLVYQYRKGERFDYAQDMADFEACLANRFKADGGARLLSMGGHQRVRRYPIAVPVLVPSA